MRRKEGVGAVNVERPYPILLQRHKKQGAGDG